MDIRDIEDAIVVALAAYLKKSPTAIKSALLKKGREMPADSFDMLEIQLALEEKFQVDFPYDERTETACRSVHAMAQLIHQLARERDVEAARG